MESQDDSRVLISNALITGGTFNLHHGGHNGNGLGHEQAKAALELLKATVVTSAMHDSDVHDDHPKCDPDTYEGILTRILDWIRDDTEDQNIRRRSIMWLSGPGKSGKSAIARTILDRCLSEGRLLGTFFFSKSDGRRDHSGGLVATFAYQLYTAFPAQELRVRHDVLQALDRDPLVFSRSLLSQFNSLVFNPLDSLFTAGYFQLPVCRRLILIDGLDECSSRESQRKILEMVSDVVREARNPLLFLVVSREEHDICATFSSQKLDGLFTHISLDEPEDFEDDVFYYLQPQFTTIPRSPESSSTSPLYSNHDSFYHSHSSYSQPPGSAGTPWRPPSSGSVGSVPRSRPSSSGSQSYGQSSRPHSASSQPYPSARPPSSSRIYPQHRPVSRSRSASSLSQAYILGRSQSSQSYSGARPLPPNSHHQSSSHHSSSSSSSRRNTLNRLKSSESVRQRRPLPIQLPPPPSYSDMVRLGYWNQRGDHLTEDGYVVYAPLHRAYPPDLQNHPKEGEGYENHEGKFASYVERPELPESLPRRGRPPECPYEVFVVYHYKI